MSLNKPLDEVVSTKANNAGAACIPAGLRQNQCSEKIFDPKYDINVNTFVVYLVKVSIEFY